MPGSAFISGRGAAMGDAMLPLGDSISVGLYNNPANLGKMRKAEAEPLNIGLYGNTGFTSTINSGFYNAVNLASYLPELQRVPGQWVGTGESFLTGFGFPGFSIGILAQTQLAGQYDSTSGAVSYRSKFQLIPAVGSGFRLFDGILRFGYSLQWVNQAVGVQTVSATSTSLAYNEGLSQGSGLANTMGIALTAPIRLLPSVNVVVRNVLGTYYGAYTLLPVASNSSGLPSTDPMTVDASFSIQPRLARGAAMNLVLVDRDVFNTTGVVFMGHVALGAEISFQDHFFLRGGWNGGYFSCGVGLKRPGGEVNLAYYTEEIGSQYMSQGDTRFLLQYQLRGF